MSRVLVIGGAGQGRQVIDAIVARGHHTVVGVLDRALRRGDVVAGIPVLGTDDDLRAAALETAADSFVVAIGDNSTRGRILDRETGAAAHLHPATVVHPAATVAHDAILGAGCILLAGAVVGNGCRIGRGVLLGINSSVDHDGWVDNHASLAPNAATGGTVRIGRTTAIGLGASVVHEVTIGADTVVGAGAVVLQDLPDRVVAFGVPARIVREREPGEPYLQRH
jgi:sugar O-acyltransferase (sialic acid O-acetyltransferase NeuD family)